MGAISARATAWRFADPDLLPPAAVNELQKQFPQLTTPEQVTLLLQEITETQTFHRLVATEQDGIITIEGEIAKIIKEIKIQTVTRTLRRLLEAKAQSFLDRVDSQQTQQRMIKKFKEALKAEGFYLAQVQLERDITGQNVRYRVLVEGNYPCLIREVSFGFSFDKSIDFGVEAGDICDQDNIEEAVNKLEEDLLAQSYNQQKILGPKVTFDPDSNSATVFVPGTLGKKITYDIQSPIHNPAIISFLFGDELNSLDPTITAPDSMRTEIIRKYRNRGYHDVEVDGPVVNHPRPDTIEYQFHVKPGPEYRITEVQIEGLTIFSQEEALEIMSLYSSLGNTPLLTQDIIREAMESLQGRYQQLGYWDAKVSYPRITKNPATGETKLVFVVEEGKRRVLTDVIVQGASVFPAKQIKSWLDVELQSPLVWSDLVEFERRLRDEYKRLGYLYTKINLDLLQNRQFRDIQTRIVLRLDEGPQVRIGQIEVKGLVQTSPEVVTRELRFEQGDIYNPEVIEESRQALVDLGLFAAVSVRPQDTNDLTQENKVIDYLIQLAEAKPGTVVFGPGWSLYEGGRFSVETSYSNLDGYGRQIFLKAAISEEKDQKPIGTKTLLGRNLGLGILEPYLFEIPVNGTLTLNHRAEAEGLQWEISRSVEGILAHKYRMSGPEQKSELFSLYKTTAIEADSAIPELIPVSEDDVQIREFGVRHQIEARNNISWPTDGYVFQGELAWADFVLGGDTKYFRWSLRHSTYEQLVPNIVFALGVSYDSYERTRRRGSNLDVLPSSELLKSGGANSNRGFPENELGPAIQYRDQDDELETDFPGGSRRFSLRLELRYQVIQDTMAISVFSDASNSFFSSREEQIIRDAAGADAGFYDNEPYQLEELFTKPKYLIKKNYLSYGLSISYLTPLGSFNLSYGFPVERCLGGRDCLIPRGNANADQITGGQLHINVGATF